MPCGSGALWYSRPSAGLVLQLSRPLADCPGTSSAQAGRAAACQGCPNQKLCAAGAAATDPGERGAEGRESRAGGLRAGPGLTRPLCPQPRRRSCGSGCAA